MLKAVVLGLLQGLTEFLPVSSSGHLVLGQHLFGLTEPELLFDVVLHVGTLLAVIAVFRHEIIALTIEFFQIPRHIKLHGDLRAAIRQRPGFRILIMIFAGSIPTALIGFFFKDAFEALFGSTLAVGAALLFTGAVLFATQFFNGHRDIRRMGVGDALLIGVAQGLAITPGLSRAGLTISTGLILGLDRELAARYSFLLFIPAILGALALQLLEAEGSSFSGPDMAAGFIAALVSGFLALVFLLKLVKRGRLYYFSFYCWVVGVITIIFSL